MRYPGLCAQATVARWQERERVKSLSGLEWCISLIMCVHLMWLFVCFFVFGFVLFFSLKISKYHTLKISVHCTSLHFGTSWYRIGQWQKVLRHTNSHLRTMMWRDRPTCFRTFQLEPRQESYIYHRFTEDKEKWQEKKNSKTHNLIICSVSCCHGWCRIQSQHTVHWQRHRVGFGQRTSQSHHPIIWHVHTALFFSLQTWTVLSRQLIFKNMLAFFLFFGKRSCDF